MVFHRILDFTRGWISIQPFFLPYYPSCAGNNQSALALKRRDAVILRGSYAFTSVCSFNLHRGIAERVMIGTYVNTKYRMEKQTLKFASLAEMARFSKVVVTGFLMNTNKFTLTGKFTDQDIEIATRDFGAVVIETTDKVFMY